MRIKGFSGAAGAITYVDGGFLKEVADEGWDPIQANGPLVFGVPGKTVMKDFYGQTYCQAELYGSDPAPGQAKKCYEWHPKTGNEAKTFDPSTLGDKPAVIDTTPIPAASGGISPLMIGGGIAGVLLIGVIIYLVKK